LLRTAVPPFCDLGVCGAVVVGAAVGIGLYRGTLGLRGKRGLAAIRANRAARETQALEAARAQLPLYRDLIHSLAISLSCQPEDTWQRFSRGFLRFGNVDEGILSAFQATALFARFDWRDFDAYQDLAAQVSEAIPALQSFDFNPEGQSDPVGSGLHALAAQMTEHGYALLSIGSDSDAYSCFVLRQEAGEEILASAPPPGIQLQAL